jgi:16S rRNA (cytosine1407-C5)-methyltransferase
VEQGSIYIQNPASLFASLVLSPKSHEEILDLAAAPGGKALHLAALMENKGRIAAVEAVKNRFFRLVTNINRADAEIIKPYLKDGSQIGRLVPERFDRVLLDAPCSSEGRFDLKDPATYAYWSEKKVKEMSHKQKRLIYSAIQALKPQGILVYCTCAFSVEENESIIQYALNKFAGKLTILPIEVPFTNYQPGLTSWGQFVFDANMQHAIRIVPDQLMNGFFICKLQKVNSTI